MKIHILGASGSGTTTLGSLIAKEKKWSHFDSDDYYWKKTNPPYTKKNSIEDRHSLLLRDLKGLENWVLSGSMDTWSDPFKKLWDLVFFIEAKCELREKRLREREWHSSS